MHSFNSTKLAYDNTKVIEKISNWLAISISKTDDFELSSKYTQLKQIEIETWYGFDARLQRLQIRL